MAIEIDLIMSILKLTKNGAVPHDFIIKDARLPSNVASKLFRRFIANDMIYFSNKCIDTDTSGRLKLAFRAIALGADIERVSGFLCWQEFEYVAAIALEKNGYIVAKNVRFKHAGRKWEIDIVGCKKPLVICIDCKHWRRGISKSALKRITEAQVKRTKALTKSLPNVSPDIECAKWNKAKFIPAVLSLTQGSFKFYEMVPLVPVFQLQDFLTQIPAYTASLKYFLKEFDHLYNDFENWCFGEP